VTKLTRALWKRRLQYRERKLHHWRSRNNHAQITKWTRLVKEARAKVTPPKPKPIPAKGIDVSNHNHSGGPIDWHKVKADGYRFAWVLQGQGDWRNPYFFDDVKAAKAAGLKAGGYHYVEPKHGRTGAQEAQWFLDDLTKAGLGKGDLRPSPDCEQEPPQLDRSGNQRYIGSFIAAMRAHGHSPMTYTGAWWWDPNVGDETFGTSLWVSHYTSAAKPTLPRAWKSWACWQFSSKGRVPGIHGDVDLNQTSDLRSLIA
jgi:lysozyme